MASMRMRTMNEIKFTPNEYLILHVVGRMIGKRNEFTVRVEDVTASLVHPDDEAFFGRNKSMITSFRHLAVKSKLGGPFIFERDAPIKRGRPVTNGTGNKAAYIVRKRQH